MQKLNEIVKKYNLDILHISNPKSIFYFTNFLSNPHERFFALVIDKKFNKYLILPKLDYELAKENIKVGLTYIAYEDGENPYEMLKKYVEDTDKIGLDYENISLHKYIKINETLKNTEIKSIDEDIKNIRVYKSLDEYEKMKKAAFYADKCIEIAKNNLRVGMTEIELKSIIETEIKKLGIKEMSFDTMVLFGKNSANPHGESGNNKLKENDIILLDLGCYFKNYASDITRCIFNGDNSKYLKIYDIVCKANKEAIKFIKPGVKFSEIDKIARDIIEKSGYGNYFTHRLGHGLGLDCHEYPDVSKYNDKIIEKNMVFTIEPGIYIPNEFGIRIEDDVIVTESGCEVLTKYEK